MSRTGASSLDALLRDVRGCRACERDLPLGPRPVVQAGASARILIVGQAPGLKVHITGVPWNDASGERLRNWMAIDRASFYDASRVALIPVGLCYPGRGPSGDLPPRRECAPLWLDRLLAELPHIELTLLVGQYAQRRFLADRRKDSLTQTVRAWKHYGPAYFPLPHPSPRNQPWIKQNPWFERSLLPQLRARIRSLA